MAFYLRSFTSNDLLHQSLGFRPQGVELCVTGISKRLDQSLLAVRDWSEDGVYWEKIDW